jgi:hypothetical protein
MFAANLPQMLEISMPKFNSLAEVKTYLAPFIENGRSGDGADVIALKYMASRLCGEDVKCFKTHLQEFDARLFVRFPDGREHELPMFGDPSAYLGEIE